MNDDAKHALRASIDNFNDISGIVVNSRSNNILCGNHRYKTLVDKYGTLDVAHLHGEYFMLMSEKVFTGFLVRMVDWDETKEKMANVTANSSLVEGEFTSGLQDVLASVKAMANDLELTMMEDLRLDDLLVDFDFDELDFDDDDKIEKIKDEKEKSSRPQEPEEEIVSHDVIKITVPIDYKDQVRMDILEFLSSKDYYNVINLV